MNAQDFRETALDENFRARLTSQAARVKNVHFSADPTAQVVNVTSATNGCAADPHNAGDVLCTITQTLPVGTDTVTVSTYDSINATGHLLSQQIYAAVVIAGVANTFSFTLDANPNNAVITVTSPGGNVTGTQGSGFRISAAAGAQDFIVSLTDAAGQTIIGPGLPLLSATSSASSAATVSMSGNSSVLHI